MSISVPVEQDLWVVAACFNEKAVITRFIERVIAQSEVSHLLLIDDGSSDSTVSVIRAWQQHHPDHAVTLLELTRNLARKRRCWPGWTMPMADVLQLC